jgi:hypothetical protein
MSISVSRRVFIITLLLPCLTYAAASNGRGTGLDFRAYADRYPTIEKELMKADDKTPPPHVEKFVSRTAKAAQPAQADDDDAAAPKAEAGDTDAARPAGNTSIHGKVNPGLAVPSLFGGTSQPRSLIDRAYLDVYEILRESNSCSQFLGGPRAATGVLNSLYPRLKSAAVENNVGISMFGPVTLVTDSQTGGAYRLFQKAVVNLRGPFYRSAHFQTQNFFRRIGRYPANTREARATMLLHELGHLLPGSDGRWLLPDDGNQPLKVAENTDVIMDRCSEQINGLRPGPAPASR